MDDNYPTSTKTSSVSLNLSYENKIHLIENEGEMDLLTNKILNDNNNPILGVDCEAAIEMSRFGILCLIQVN